MAATTNRQAAAGLDRASVHRRRESQLPGGRGVHGAAGARRRLPAGDGHRDRRRAGRLRDARRRRARRRSGIYFMYDVKQFDPAEWTLAAARGAARRQAGRRQGDRRPRRGQSEGARVGVSGGASRVQGARTRRCRSTWCWSRRARRRSRSPHFAQLVTEPDVKAALARPSASSSRGVAGSSTASSPVSLGAKGVVELQLISSGEKWGRGPSKDIHSSLKAHGRQPGLASGQGARHARFGRRQHAGDRRLVRACAAADGAPEGADRRRRRSVATKPTSKKRLGIKHWIKNEDYLTGHRPARVAADGQHRGPGQRLYRARRQDGPAGTAPRRRSTCGWSPT